jgi:ATPase subunit of ABC transporter with duplicated ATPase domains
MSSRIHASDAQIVATGLGYALPDGRALFHNLTLSFGRERTGLIGPNGSGKTTLLRLLAGELVPAAGSVRRNGVLAVLPQEVRPEPGAVLSRLLDIDDRLAALRRLEAGRGTVADVERVGDHWDLPGRAAAVLTRFGLDHLSLDRPVEVLSGGEVTRAALAGLTLRSPGILLLDEPTNHLDAGSREALYAFVGEWTGGAVCVSHDRELLRRMDRIVELSSLGVRVYGGNYDDFYAQRETEQAAAELELDSAHAALRGAEQKAREVRERQARSRVATARERIEEREEPRFHLGSTDLPAGRSVLQIEHVVVRFGGASAPVLDGVSLRIRGPERVAVVGSNGSGKTTLLRVAIGDLAPDEGMVRRLPQEEIAFLDQNGARLDPARSVLENFRAFHPRMEDTATRYALARFLFAHDAALQVVATLSGGQRLRASLACVLGAERPPAFLVLDEPTNHLDLESMSAMESALREYDGALLVVSHDTAFLEAIGVERRIVLK